MRRLPITQWKINHLPPTLHQLLLPLIIRRELQRSELRRSGLPIKSSEHVIRSPVSQIMFIISILKSHLAALMPIPTYLLLDLSTTSSSSGLMASSMFICSGITSQTVAISIPPLLPLISHLSTHMLCNLAQHCTIKETFFSPLLLAHHNMPHLLTN